MAGRLWVFDLDDTLVPTSQFYSYATVKFLNLMLDTFGGRAPDWFVIAQLFRKIDNDRVKIHGNAHHRFPGSLTICYRQLCKQVGVPVDEGVVAWVRRIGEEVFSLDLYLQDALIPGVEETLDFLEARRDEILVLTKGDLLIQWRKWQGYRLERWFPTSKEFRVVRWDPRLGYPGDKGQVLVELRGKYPQRKIYMVGDSVDSDIIPAIEAGVSPIYIPAYGRWSWRPVTSPLPEGVKKIAKITVLIDEYDQL